MKELIGFDKEQTEELLGELDRRLRTRGVAATIYLVGGAAIGLTVSDSRRTRHLDAIVSDRLVLHEAALMAVEMSLPSKWLNESARPWIPARPAEALIKPRGPGLTVHVAPLRHLLAMKMVAMRRQDLADIVALAGELGMTDAPTVAFALLLRDVYAGEGVLEQALGIDPVDDEVAAITTWVVQLLEKQRR